MRLIRNIFLALVTLFILSVTGLGLFAWLRQDKLTAAIVEKVNETINTKISYGSLDVTIFQDFPNITIRFNDLHISPSQYYDKTQFKGYSVDTLFYASSFSLSAHLPSLITGTISIRSITAKNGVATLLTDKRGGINFEVFASDKEQRDKNIKLNNISVTDIKTIWYDRQSDLMITGIINESNLGGEIFKSGIFLNASMTASLSSVDVYGLHIHDIPAEGSVKLRKTDNSLAITKGSLDLAGLSFGIDGTVNHSMKVLDLLISGRKINLTDLSRLLSGKLKGVAEGLNPAGLIDLSCKINGQYGEAGTPHFEIGFSLSGGRVGNIAIPLKVNDLAFKGYVSNGKMNEASTFILNIDTLTSSFGKSTLCGSFSLRNLKNPYVELSLNGDLVFDDLRKIIKTDFIRNQKGEVKGSVKLDGVLPDSLRFSSADLPQLNPEALLVFKDFGATISSDNLELSEVNGEVTIDDNLSTDSLAFIMYGQRFMVNAEMSNFIGWLAGGQEIMEVTGDISADTFIPAHFTRSEKETGEEKEPEVTIFPRDMTMNVRIKADSIVSGGFSARNFSSIMTYRPHVFTFSDIRAEGLDGMLSGNLILGRQNDGSYISRARLEVNDIDINKAFTSFNNFGQKFIVSKNLEGRLTGNVTMLAPLDHKFKIITKALVAEAHLSITNGHLKDFKPVESLSKFIDLDELKDIAFSKFENDLYIRNSSVSIPKMLINSSACNFTVYGNHSFGGDYSYHIRVLLSEVLSRKARESNRHDDSFGKVKVDDSGKATIPLKIVCENGKTDVSYDFGQAQENIKENITDEKQTLKGILNEEYGWYKGDTIKKTVQEQKPKFVITWEEGRDQTADTITEEEKETDNPLKGLLKKKRK